MASEAQDHQRCLKTPAQINYQLTVRSQFSIKQLVLKWNHFHQNYRPYQPWKKQFNKDQRH